MAERGELTHVDERGAARMVDVSGKDPTGRRAVAEAFVTVADDVRDQIFAGGLPKGDAVAVVRVAAVMAAKQTPHLVPLCHPIPLDSVEVEVEPTSSGAHIVVTAATTARTGVEMEAITGAGVGAITLYDMVKSLDRGAEIGPVRLVEKTGGKSGHWRR